MALFLGDLHCAKLFLFHQELMLCQNQGSFLGATYGYTPSMGTINLSVVFSLLKIIGYSKIPRPPLINM